MSQLVRRLASTERAFPPVESDLYSFAAASTFDKGARILRLATADVPAWRQICGVGLDAQGKLARLLRFHRLGFEAEREGREARADFFWREVHRQLRRSWSAEPVWQTAVNVAGDDRRTSFEWRDRLIAEIFIDTHAAFANAPLKSEDPLAPDDRALTHGRYIAGLCDLLGLTADARSPLIGPLIEAEMIACEKANRWAEAISGCRRLVELKPGDPGTQDRLALLHFRAVIARLSEKPDGAELIDAARLATGIQELEALRRSNPDHGLLYDLISHLENLRAVRLANGGSLSEALVAARRAQTYDPANETAQKTAAQLIDNMSNLQAQMRELEANLKKTPNARLNAEGVRMQGEARAGFGPVNRFIEGEAAEIAAARDLGAAHRLWRDAGLSIPEARWDESSTALYAAMVAIYGQEGSDPQTVAAAFRQQVYDNPDLVAVDAMRVASFILRRRAGGPPVEPVSPAAEPEPAMVPIIEAGAPRRRSREPFLYWWFGERDLPVRLLGVAASVVLLVVLGLLAFDAYGSHVRAQAFAALEAAAARDDDQAVLREAERFRDAHTLSNADRRVPRVDQLAQAAEEAPHRRIRDDAAAKLQAALQGGDQEAAIAAAEAFLGGPPLAGSDPRQAAVMDAYTRTMARWFASVNVPLNAPARDRLNSFHKLAAVAR